MFFCFFLSDSSSFWSFNNLLASCYNDRQSDRHMRIYNFSELTRGIHDSMIQGLSGRTGYTPTVKKKRTGFWQTELTRTGHIIESPNLE